MVTECARPTHYLQRVICYVSSIPKYLLPHQALPYLYNFVPGGGIDTCRACPEWQVAVYSNSIARVIYLS